MKMMVRRVVRRLALTLLPMAISAAALVLHVAREPAVAPRVGSTAAVPPPTLMPSASAHPATRLARHQEVPR